MLKGCGSAPEFRIAWTWPSPSLAQRRFFQICAGVGVPRASARLCSLSLPQRRRPTRNRFCDRWETMKERDGRWHCLSTFGSTKEVGSHKYDRSLVVHSGSGQYVEDSCRRWIKALHSPHLMLIVSLAQGVWQWIGQMWRVDRQDCGLLCCAFLFRVDG